ncbi:transcriptional activator Myb-like [Cynara cardunculus var. scolymus]|uniref:transcriptional activator Myb-like n=1 Tax=Cynara cardunculus var. scolymus TaxID=59895 RepID=UPI000D6291D2|nr:transcriptional activator Myb-like [Cynara cardunculus var. scolymus]
MASSSSQSVHAGVSDDGHQNHQMETRRIVEVPNRVVSRPNMAKRHWTRWEDFKLIKHIVAHGGRNWKIISDQLPGRTPESCKVRWSSTLNPLLKKPPLRRQEEPISEEELGRTDVYVKIFYHALMAKKHASMNPTSSPMNGAHSVVSSVSPSGKTAHSSGIDLNGPSDVYEQRTGMGNNCGICKKTMENEESFMASMHLPSTSLNPITLATNNDWQPTESPPKLIDFMGVGSV